MHHGTNGVNALVCIAAALLVAAAPGTVVADASEAPGPPPSLQASSGPGAGQISLTWSPPAGTILHYLIYRAAPGAALGLHAKATTPSFTDGGLQEGSEWRYTVTAVDAGGEGPPGQEVVGFAPARPGPPTNLEAFPDVVPQTIGSPALGLLRLTWDAPADTGHVAITGYRVYRGSSPASLAFLASAPAETTFVDNTALVTDTYYYQIRATNVAGTGPPSEVACGVPAPWVDSVSPVTDDPCPLPPGWVERVLVDDYEQSIGLPGPSTPEIPVLEIHGAPDAVNPAVYVVRGTVAGLPIPPIRLPTSGLLAHPLEVIMTIPSVSTFIPPHIVRFGMYYRFDADQFGACDLGVGDVCFPLKLTDPTWAARSGGRAALVMTVEVEAPNGQVVLHQSLTVPFVGQAAGPLGLPAVPV